MIKQILSSGPKGDVGTGAFLLEKKSRRQKITLAVRILSILFIAMYIRFAYKYHFDWYAYTVRYFVAAFISYTVHSIACNFGLFFITTEMAKKFKKMATLFYIPTFLITPIIAGAFLSYVGTLILFLGSILLYRYFNPWRRQ